MASTDVKIIHLGKEDELKIRICKPDDKIYLKLTEGSAEIFGSQLCINEVYEFSYFSSVTVFTVNSCTLEIKKEASEYSKYEINSSKQIPKMFDIHRYLEEFRTNAELNNTDGPVTVIVGPTDVGKSTLCRFLLNYATKFGRKPVFVDLDVGQGSLSMTGTFGILSVNEPSDIHGRFNQQRLTVYYFGYNSPGHNMKLFKLLLEKVGKSLKKRLCQEYHSKSSGVVINTCGWIDGGGYKLIKDIINFLDVNVVIVLSKNSLYYKLKTDVPKETKVLRVTNMRGAVVRDKTVRANNRNASVYEYFYGSTRQIQPYTIKVSFNDLCIYKENFSSKKSSHNEEKHQNVISVSIEPSILYHILGLSYTEQVKDILQTSVYGFICIVDIDMDSEIALVLSPKPGPLPTKYLLMGSIKLTSS